MPDATPSGAFTAAAFIAKWSPIALPDGHPLATARAQTDQAVLANLLRLNQGSDMERELMPPDARRRRAMNGGRGRKKKPRTRAGL